MYSWRDRKEQPKLDSRKVASGKIVKPKQKFEAFYQDFCWYAVASV
jgi:hypothetical protein